MKTLITLTLFIILAGCTEQKRAPTRLSEPCAYIIMWNKIPTTYRGKDGRVIYSKPGESPCDKWRNGQYSYMVADGGYYPLGGR